MRMEIADGAVVVSRTDVSHAYSPSENTVYISDSDEQKVTLSPWIGGAFFQKLQREVPDWNVTYAQDRGTGRDIAVVTCSSPAESKFARRWRFVFDPGTKLLVRFEQWNSREGAGVPAFSAEEITYDLDLDDALFDYEIPEGVRVIDKRKGA